MITQQTYQPFYDHKKLISIALVCIVLLIGANVLLDFAFTWFQNSSFYFSESLLFSSYWLLFFPLLILMLKATRRIARLESKMVVVVIVIILHSILYPALVWIISKLFYSHTFNYWQTFNYSLSAYFIKTVLIYGFALTAFTMLNKRTLLSSPLVEDLNEFKDQDNISSILVSDGSSKKLLLQVNDILYFSANSPYVNICHSSKTYLHNETLKSLEAQLNPEHFIRIHKSHLVNLRKVSSIQSRQNGDYDIMLSDYTLLRMSRNYARNFKTKFSAYHHLST